MSFVATAPAVPNPWARILGALEKKVNRQSFDTWLKPTRFSHITGRMLFVRVPTPEFQHIGDRYGDLIQEAIDAFHLEFDDVSFVIPQEEPAAGARARGWRVCTCAFPLRRRTARRQSRGVRRRRRSRPSSTGPPPRSSTPATPSRPSSSAMATSSPAPPLKRSPNALRKPTTRSSSTAVSAWARPISMHAIGHEVKKRQPQCSVCYVSSEKFTNEMINSLRYDKMTSFRDKFRSVDLLLIDDIQFLAQKERTQEEFFHTFNALHESMKQIVIASDRPPKELPEIEDRLRSRFEWGLIADIQPPDLETKVAILQKKAESEHVLLPTDIALFIASNVRTNVRELEGAMVRLLAWCRLNGAELTLATTQLCLKQFIDTQVRKITIEAIQRAVSEQFGMRVAELKQKNNSRSVVVPRQIAMYLAKQMTEASLPEIGRQFGGKHHTTVMHSIAKIDEQRRADKDLNRTINKLLETLNG